MIAIHETAYPRFKPHLTDRELQEVFTLSMDERDFIQQKTKSKNTISRLGFALLLKCYQYLGHFTSVANVPPRVKTYLAEQLGVDAELDLTGYAKATQKRHRQAIRIYLDIITDKQSRRAHEEKRTRCG